MKHQKENRKKQIEKLKGNQRTKGYKHTDAWKEKARKRMMGNTNGFKKGCLTAFKKGHMPLGRALKGHTTTEETKRRIKETKNKFFADPIKSAETRKRQSESRINHPAKVFCNTSIEKKIAKELIKREICFQQNIGLCNIANVDFYLPDYQIVIECDGDYWHNKPGAKEKDERKTALLEFNGFNVYRFWGHEINESPEKCIDKLKI